MSFELLSEPIRKFIRTKGWSHLRPIQNAAIPRILSSDENFILVSKTASGKTEAAFLPILSKINFNEPGVQVMYISPLIALINDQFYRIEDLCKNLEVTVTKWHGESSKSLKDKLIKNPHGIVLITPESIEAMFVNKPFNVKQLFSNLKYVVIDEIHSFIGTDRGMQLKSILSRLQEINVGSFSIVGLSATLGDYNEAKKMTGNVQKTKVLIDSSPRETTVAFKFFGTDTPTLAPELIIDLYHHTQNSKVLIFPNSRGRVEETAVSLKRLAVKKNGHSNYFSHHSSVDKEIREFIENFAKNNYRDYFTISCTSTLELGIDIGNVDSVVQIDSTYSISSLIQRVGRSGRQEGKSGKLILYSTNQYSLLQSLACWTLYKEGFIEPPNVNPKPYDILLHQALSITKGYSGIEIPELIKKLQENAAFSNIEYTEIIEILEYLIKTDLLEKIQTEVIIGVNGEKIVNNKNFYSMFQPEENFKVLHKQNKIGELPYSPIITVDENILLAAKIWKIKFIDERTRRIEVIPANDAKSPIFFGSPGITHPKVREKMLELLLSDVRYDFLDEASTEILEDMRRHFRHYNIKDLSCERPLLYKETDVVLFTFTGTRINYTLSAILNMMGIQHKMDDTESYIRFSVEYKKAIKKLNYNSVNWENLDKYIENTLIMNPTMLDFSKWGIYLPFKYQFSLLRNQYYDIEATQIFLQSLKMIVYES